MDNLVLGRIVFDDPFFRSFQKVNVGFDAMIDRLQHLAERHEEIQRMADCTFPPVNILNNGNRYRVEMAVAGYAKDDITISVEKDVLKITGKQKKRELAEGTTFLHQGIAGRSFERKFILNEFLEVVGANLIDGMLYIDLEKRVPPEKQPRMIQIGTAATPWQLEVKPESR